MGRQGRRLGNDLSARLVTDHLTEARRIVQGMLRTRRAGYLRDDLTSAAYEALLQAARRYRPGKGRFWAFARQRIVGAVQDELRAKDIYSRDQRKAMREGRDVPPREILDGATSDAVLRYLPSAENPETAAILSQAHRRLAAAVADLPAQQRRVVDLHLEGMTLKETGAIMCCSESRACQILDAARKRLRESLTGALS